MQKFNLNKIFNNFHFEISEMYVFICLTIFFKLSESFKQSEECQLAQYKKDKYFHKAENYDMFKNFHKFEDLILGCNQTYNNSNFIIFFPHNPIIIDESLALNEIIINKAYAYVICMNGFKGIDMNTARFYLNQAEFYFAFSTLNLYSNNQLINKMDCNAPTFYNTTSFFKNFFVLTFIYFKYNEPLCPYLFKDAYLQTVYFSQITNSLLNYNHK